MQPLVSSTWLQDFHDSPCSRLISVDYIHSATSATPLMVAAGRGFPAVVEQLLALGANANLRASNGWTALDWAKRFNQAEVVELLEAHM